MWQISSFKTWGVCHHLCFFFIPLPFYLFIQTRLSHCRLARSKEWDPRFIYGRILLTHSLAFKKMSEDTLIHANRHTLTVMTVVLVAFKELMEGGWMWEKHFRTSCLTEPSEGRQAKKVGGQADPAGYCFHADVELDTDLFYWPWSPSPSLSFTLVFPICLSPPLIPVCLSLCETFISLFFSLHFFLSFSHPSEV